MKKSTFIMVLVLAVLFNLNTYAQRTCAAHDVMTEQLQKNPKMKLKVEELEKFTFNFIKSFPVKATNTRTIPVYVHVIYKTTQENISDAQIQSQIDVMNIDYGGTNSDISNVPAEFVGVTAQGTGIDFVIAGITRKQSSTTSWGTNDAMKKSSQGGVDPITPDTHMNMWICNIGGGILGYAQFPGGDASTDGVVFSPQYCGSSDYDDGSFYLSAPFDKGRTAVHEVGHYLNLRHIWGDGACSASDYVDDTPSAESANYNCPSHPHYTCNSNDMFMNYMDYVDDACMFMFSEGQSARMWACLNSTRENLGYSDGNAAPVANANGPYADDPGVAISFSSAGSTDSDGSIASFHWDFGDGATSTQANPAHTYATEGLYNIVLTVTDDLGKTDTDNTTATIGDVCTGIAACDGNISLTLITDNYGSETSWTLKNSAGTTIESGSGYGKNTTYNINWNLAKDTYTFTINDSYGDGICCSYGNGSYTLIDGCNTTLKSGGSFNSSESTTFCVPDGGTPVNQAPVANANGPYTADEGVNISFSSAGSNDSDGSIASYNWNFGDGNTSSQANPSYAYATPGSYTATLTVTDNEGATGTNQAAVTVTEITTNDPMISSIAISTVKTGKRFKAIADITVTANGQAVEGANVDITWSGDVSATNSAVTNSQGEVQFVSAKVKSSYFVITIDGITKSGYIWDEAGSQTTASTGSARLDESISDKLMVYPNPATNQLTIEFDTDKNVALYIYNLNGQELKTIPMLNPITEIDISDLSPGMYIIKARTSENTFTQKFQKQ